MNGFLRNGVRVGDIGLNLVVCEINGYFSGL